MLHTTWSHLNVLREEVRVDRRGHAWGGSICRGAERMMRAMNLVDNLRSVGVVPIVALPDVALALPLAQALLDGGLRCAEITFRTEAGAPALTLIRQQFPELLLGAGTVLTANQADRAIDAGAQFIVSPGTNLAVVDHVLARGEQIIPGITTPSELEVALTREIELVKFFPAEQFGGVATIRALTGPYPRVRYFPTGGISPDNLGAYLRLPEVVACGGSWMARSELLTAHDFATVTRLSREAAAIVAATRPAHSTVQE